MKKSPQGPMFWHKIGLLAAVCFSLLYGATLIFSQTKNTEVVVNNRSDTKIEIETIANQTKTCGDSQGCKVVFSDCNCNFQCIKEGVEIETCDKECEGASEVQREMMSCECVNEECQFIEPNFKTTLNDKIDDKSKVAELLKRYFEAEENCDVESATSSITKNSQKMVDFNCANMKREFSCNGGAKMQFAVRDDEAVAYAEPFSYEQDNPYFFSKEEGEWKLDLYKMAQNLTMLGGDCEGWTWRRSDSSWEFCKFFSQNKCPANKLR